MIISTDNAQVVHITTAPPLPSEDNLTTYWIPSPTQFNTIERNDTTNLEERRSTMPQHLTVLTCRYKNDDDIWHVTSLPTTVC